MVIAQHMTDFMRDHSQQINLSGCECVPIEEPACNIGVMTTATMPLNNDGDTVLMLDATGVVRSRVAYAVDQVGVGVWLELAK